MKEVKARLRRKWRACNSYNPWITAPMPIRINPKTWMFLTNVGRAVMTSPAKRAVPALFNVKAF